MLLRTGLLISWLALGACVSSDLDAPVGEIVAAPGSPVLEAEPPPHESTLPNESVELRVRYRDAAGHGIAGVQVDFALTAVAPGASLSPWRVTTDDQGVATTRLTVGSMPGQLVVRAGARETGSVYMRVQVGEVVKTRVAVRVAYAGTRKVSAYIVSAVPELPCAEALATSAVGDVVHRFGGGDEQVGFELDARERSAIVAWGRDESGGQLARGCTEFSAREGEAEAALVLPLDDTPLRVDRPVAMALRLRVGPSAARFAALAREVVATLLEPYEAHAEAALYLDAIGAQSGLAPNVLATHRAALAAHLAEAEVGPAPLASALGAALTRSAAGLLVRTRYPLHDEAPTVESLHALARDDDAALALAPRPELSLESKLEPGEARLVVTSLRVALSLGVYGKAVLSALDASDEEGLADALEAAAGCRAVVGPWTAAAGLGDAALGEAACHEIVRDLRARYDDALGALAGAALELSGTLEARDRSEDGVIDELGPSPLEGRWTGGDPVQGEVRAPAQTTLVL